MRIDEIELPEDDEPITEAAPKRKRVVRGGKVIKKKQCPHGFKLVGGTRCVKQSSQERRARRIAAKRGAKKGKAARKRSRMKSLRLRKRRHL